MSHIPYYGEEPSDTDEPRRVPTPPRSDHNASSNEDARALRSWEAYRGAF